MNKPIIAIIHFLVHHHYIGGKHFPEDKLITSRTRHLNKDGQKEFEKEYERIKPYLIRLKKKTGKSSSWHISIDPKHLADIENLLKL
jgi:hypothetical protein